MFNYNSWGGCDMRRRDGLVTCLVVLGIAYYLSNSTLFKVGNVVQNTKKEIKQGFQNLWKPYDNANKPVDSIIDLYLNNSSGIYEAGTVSEKVVASESKFKRVKDSINKYGKYLSNKFKRLWS